jgi:triosephosphate isomerase
MNDGIRPLISGNWKMNGLKGSMAEFEAMLAGGAAFAGRADLLVCPPATLIAGFAEKAKGRAVAIGAQDCHQNASGAHTGDLSAEMLKDAGATSIIVGHSERRADHGYSSGHCNCSPLSTDMAKRRSQGSSRTSRNGIEYDHHQSR